MGKRESDQELNGLQCILPEYSAALYQLILDNSQEFISIHKLSDLSFEYINPAALKLLGYTQEELFAKNPSDLIHPDDKERVLHALADESLIRGGRIELRCLKRDGSYSRLKTRALLAELENEAPLLICISRKIKELLRKKSAQPKEINRKAKSIISKKFFTEKALRKSKNYYRTIFENTGTATVIIGEDFKIAAANLKTEQLTGYSREELVGLNPFEQFITPEYLLIAQEYYKQRKLDSSKAPREYEIECRDRLGEIKRVMLNIAKVPGSEEMVVSVLDVTEQHRAQTQLKDSELRFRTLFEEAPVGIGISRDDLTLVVNKAYRNMFAYRSCTELLGTCAADQVAPGCREEFAAKIRCCILGKNTATPQEVAGQRRDGSTFSVLVQIERIVLSDGPAAVCFLTDFSVQKQLVINLRQQVEAQNIMLEISKNFSNIVTYNIDAMITLTLQQIGEFYHCDRCNVFLFSEDGMVLRNTHEWCAEGIRAVFSSLQELPTKDVPWWMSKLRNRETVYIQQAADWPAEARLSTFFPHTRDIKSLLTVPVVADDSLLGFINFISIREERLWSPENIVMLESVAIIISRGLSRKFYADFLLASESYHRTLFENTGTATMIVEQDLTISMANTQCGLTLNCNPQELIGKKWTEFVQPDIARKIADYFYCQRRCETKTEAKRWEARMITKQGLFRDGLLLADLIPDTQKLVTTFVDMTKMMSIDRAFKAISAINDAIIYTDNEADLLRSVCEKVVEIGGYRMAIIAYIEDTPEQKVKVVADAGYNHGYTNKLNISLQDPNFGKGPCGLAIQTQKQVVYRNIKNEPSFKPWLKEALKRGYKACMTIPLLNNKEVFGVLGIYSDITGGFNSEEEKLLVKLGDNLAYGIMSLRARKAVGKEHHFSI